MGMRKYQRDIARARMSAMGVKSNILGSGIMPHGNRLRKKMKNAHGRAYLESLRKEKAPRWKRVTTGDLSRKALTAQMVLGQRIKKQKMVQDSMKKRKIRKIRPIDAPAQ